MTQKLVKRKAPTLRQLLERINEVVKDEPSVLDRPARIDSLDQPEVTEVGWSGGDATLFFLLT